MPSDNTTPEAGPASRTDRYRAVVDAAYHAGVRCKPDPPYRGEWRTTEAQAEADAHDYLATLAGEVVSATIDVVRRSVLVAPGHGKDFCNWDGDHA
jgi:hypothetical protein